MARDERDRRLEPRLEGAEISVEFLAPIPRARDLSTSGLYIEDPHPLQRGQTVELRLTLGSTPSIVVTAMIRRVEPGVGMAVEFIHVDAAARRRIKDYISHADPAKISQAGPDV